MAVIKGEGFLEFGGREVPVTYSVELWSNSRARGGDGRVNGDYKDLDAALRVHDVILRLDDGRKAAVVLTDLNPVTGSRITLNEPLA